MKHTAINPDPAQYGNVLINIPFAMRILWMSILIFALSNMQILWAVEPYSQDQKQVIGEAQSLNVDRTELWVLGPLIDVYLGPGAGYPIVHTLEKGEKVILTKQFTQWVKITSRDTNHGWIKQQDLVKLADAKGRPLTSKRLAPKKAGAFSVQFAVGTLDSAMGGTGGIGYGLSENLRIDILLNHITESYLQGRGLKGQLTLDLEQIAKWQPYLNMGYGSYNTDGTISGQDNFNAFKAGFGARRHLIGGLEGTIEYAKELILISGPGNIHADAISLGILTYF